MTDALRDVRSICPECGYRCDSVMQAGGDRPVRPADGDVSICLRCAAVSLFAAAEPGGLRRPRMAELAELMKEPAVIASITGILAMNSRGGGVPYR